MTVGFSLQAAKGSQ